MPAHAASVGHSKSPEPCWLRGRSIMNIMVQANTAPKLRHQPPTIRFWESVAILHRRRTTVIALFSAVAIVAHLVLRFAFQVSPGIYRIPLWATFIFGGIPLIYELARNLLRREF